ncbi:MAG: extracellular solute-binding protein [Oscillospiraceae bacterium]|nr:extracellular solute-binding protein [Oscillospiraceae bacterium]
MKHTGSIIAVTLCMVWLLTGCGKSVPGGANALSCVPPEQQMVLYTSHPAEIYAPFVREFEERTGIWVQVETGGSQELLNRIADEAQTPVADVMFGGGVESLEGCRSYFASYASTQLPAISHAGFVGADNCWTGFSALPLVIIYNTKLVSERDAPTTWQSLIDLKWRGRIAFVSPEVSGSCYTAVATAVQLYGDNYVTQFVENLDGRCLKESRDIVTRVADGSYSVGITLESSAQQAIADGADVAYLYPEDGTSAVPDGIAVLKGAPNFENACLFVDFVLSRDAQAYLSSELNRRAVRDDIPLEGMQRLENIPLMEYDVDWAAAKKPAILALWQQVYVPTQGGTP